MKLSKFILVVIGVVFLFYTPLASASVVVPFGDDRNYWPGWGNGSGDDSRDRIGIPDFTGGTASFNGGYLTQLTIDRTPQTHLYWALSPGDLFIDTGADGDWDYIVDLASWTTPGPNNPDPGPGSYDIYSLNLALDTGTGYILSGKDYAGGWSGYNIRNDHPATWDDSAVPGTASGQVDFSGWGGSGTTSYTFDFTGLGLDVGTGPLIIGWSVNCANDVIYAEINPVPEPATILLLGSGLIGLGALRRKKKTH
jgi:hypothetical protein